MSKKHTLAIILAFVMVFVCACTKTDNTQYKEEIVPETIVEIIDETTIPEEIVDNTKTEEPPITTEDVTEESEINETIQETEKETTTPPQTEHEPSQPPKEENLKNEEEIKKPVNPIRIINKITSVESFLNYPKESDFGSQYNKAIKLYDAIINKSGNIKLDFTTGNTTDDWQTQTNFFRTFEEKVMSNAFEITRDSFSGAYIYTELNASQVYDGIMALNDYRNAIVSLGINENTEAKDAVIKINNYLCNRLTYELSANNPYNSFVNKTANCEGYARLFDRFCFVIGVQTEYESGRVKTNGEYGQHAWNKVKIGSEWFYIDVCWNDSSNPNRYLLSKTLWSDHTSQIHIDVKTPSGVSSGNKISFTALPTSITDLIAMPTEDDYSDFYEQAMVLYNGIINGDSETVVMLYTNETITDVYLLYDEFEKTVVDKMFDNAFDLSFSGISWRSEDGHVKATLNTGKIYKTAMETINNANLYRQANISAGIKDGMSELDAIKKMVNWLCNQTTYSPYESKSAVEALKNKIVDFQWYGPIFKQMCRDVGIECEVIKGAHPYSAYWNRVKIGEKWYYTDIWYYFCESFKNYESYEYFLSETLWPNHTIKE